MRHFFATLILCCLGSATFAEGMDKAADEFFERKVRPLLVERCYSCHGRGQKKGELRLDSREGLLAGGESGTVAVPGKPEDSLLIKAVERTGDVVMPPDDKLTPQEVAILKQWFTLGLPWPASSTEGGGPIRSDGTITDADRQFWSFRPVQDHAPPGVKQAAWPKRSLDHFVLNRLEDEGLQPVAEGDRRVLIRRASFDLTGLPPTAEEVDSFAADERPEAYPELIERLLASPHYGERWARHWLDVARYGEDQAHTFAARMYPSGYRYRDWIIRALNEDMPYDQFVTEQIAGDLLDGGDKLARLPALGLFALGPVYYADAGCANKAKADEYDDRIDTLTRGLLGLTVACARCHDHKFDPISTRDYYALAGVFASTDYREAPLAADDVVQKYDTIQANVKAAEQRLKDAEKEEARKVGESFASHTADYLVSAWKVQNRRKTDGGYKITAAIEGTELKEFVVDRWLQYLASDQAKKNPALTKWFELVNAQDAKQDLTSDAAIVDAMTAAATEVQTQLLATIEKRRELDKQYADQIAALKEVEKKPDKPALDKPLAELLKELVDDSSKAPFAFPKDRVDKLLAEDAKQRLAGIQKEIEELKKSAGPKYPIAHSLTDGKPANLKVHIRGSHTDLGDEAPRRFLGILSPADAKPFEQGSGRLELARAIASPANPLTARVIVNRVWQQHFGRGIVGTPSNFGLLGERPTHPELLDHLAAKFIAFGWSLKQLHREIMLSATYRLASSHHAANQERDPDNRLLWRANRRRLDVESWRDAILTASGNLDLAVGGPSLDLANDGNRRRTLYAAISRHDLNPTLRLFDFPDPNLTSERRVMTTVPMQQLFVLNSDFMIRQAKALAAHVQGESLSDDARLDKLYQLVLTRLPRDREREVARAFLAKPSTDAKLNRWEQLSQALLSTNEFVFVD